MRLVLLAFAILALASLAAALPACSGSASLKPGLGVEHRSEGPEGVRTSETFLTARVGEIKGGAESPVPKAPTLPPVTFAPTVEVKAPAIPGWFPAAIVVLLGLFVWSYFRRSRAT
jgi:hypothetical protein